eukprot:2986355-Rhodomonas_salina.1
MDTMKQKAKTEKVSPVSHSSAQDAQRTLVNSEKSSRSYEMSSNSDAALWCSQGGAQQPRSNLQVPSPSKFQVLQETSNTTSAPNLDSENGVVKDGDDAGQNRTIDHVLDQIFRIPVTHNLFRTAAYYMQDKIAPYREGSPHEAKRQPHIVPVFDSDVVRITRLGIFAEFVAICTIAHVHTAKSNASPSVPVHSVLRRGLSTRPHSVCCTAFSRSVEAQPFAGSRFCCSDFHDNVLNNVRFRQISPLLNNATATPIPVGERDPQYYPGGDFVDTLRPADARAGFTGGFGDGWLR